MLTRTTPYIKHPAAFDRSFRTEEPAPIFRRHFSVGEDLVSAKLSYSALGLGKLYLNGEPVSEDLLTSPFSDYRKTLWYNSYDVTALLTKGENIAAAMLGNGFFNESLHTSWDFNEADWRDSPKLRFSLELTYADRVEYVESDTDWLCDIESSPVRFNEMRFGERFDARFATDWMKPDFDDSGWTKAVIASDPGGEPIENPAEPIREDCAYNCVSLTKNARGAYIFDFGQNMSGYVRVRTAQPSGTKLHIIYAEELDENGERADNSLSGHYRDGETQFSEVTTSDAPLDWKPIFSYYGFRYAIIDGFAVEPTPETVQAIFVHQAMKQIGRFTCSDETLDTMWRFARLSTLSNLFNMPTDCPTREKLGWCNDAMASCEQMIQNFDMRRFYKKWLRDICDAVNAEGDLPGIIPTSGWGYKWGNGPTSSGILFEIPMRLYQYTGSDETLREAYPSMKRHLDFLETKATDGLISYGLEDWAMPGKNPVPLELTCTLLMIKFLRIAALAAERSGLDPKPHKERERFYTESFKRHYIGADGRLTLTEQTSSAMTIALGIGDLDALKPQFYETFEKYDWHFNVGMLGMQYMLPACDICGFVDEGFRLLTADGYPSYRLWFSQGATLLPEMWNNVCSKNHHMYSCPIAWFHNSILGIRCDEKLFTERRFTLEPHFPIKLDYAEGEYETPVGKIFVAWRRSFGKVKLSVSIPDGLTAELKLDCGTRVLSAGRYELTI
ncbi:MAG: family 78 glycoside hydrolase catalytic domain [Candidatus Flemingiibacterium sp.]